MSGRNAEKNNEKLFPLFRRNLSENNVGLYAATADKLALWAARDKAYYPFARPVIVELLETANSQVRRHSNAPDKPFHISECPESLKPWVEPYIKLLKAVAPFYHLFPEPQLQARLRALLQTINFDLPATQPTRPPSHSASPHIMHRAAHSASPVNRLHTPVIPGSAAAG
ncbi:uncharacterized protein C8Q71DRAFT_296108 [Rhodofomes roseus]|uniref:Uncharacterized protein n=1 Tax=Rhodofomes roseus TaxID=34475 RepID=A0ABQ8K438_9APHY|nr:uncharacterized protein C8Q71DRAFT_296108 [Rhodofomes roseus]KAH9831625.1 hypothetical protein C8Q71DRAFT_296108 [Rhodofomes roseus]